MLLNEELLLDDELLLDEELLLDVDLRLDNELSPGFLYCIVGISTLWEELGGVSFWFTRTLTFLPATM